MNPVHLCKKVQMKEQAESIERDCRDICPVEETEKNMAAKVALCVEEEACRNLGIIGLEDEDLAGQSWLDVYTTGEETRRDLGEKADVDELWVLSCDDVEPINLAASVKLDHPDLCVRLVTSELCGSLFSRAHTADIDEVMDQSGFLKRYAEMKGRARAHVLTVDNELKREGKTEGEERVSLRRKVLGVGRPRKEESQSERSRDIRRRADCFDEGESAEKGKASPVIDEAALQSIVEEIIPPVEVIGDEPPQTSPKYLQLHPHPALVAAATESRAFMLTVVSGSGGAGKSSVAALGALLASDWGYKTLLLDCDLQFGDVSSMVGEDHALCVDEAIAHPDRLETEMARPAKLIVLAAPTRLEASEEVVHQLPQLLDRVSEVFEVIVVNTGASWAEQHALLLERSSVALFLIDQRVSSVRSCRHAIELCARCGIAATPFQYALNRCAKGAPLSALDVSSALQGAQVFELKDGGRDVEDFLSGGAARELIETKNEFARSLERVLERLLPRGMGLRAETIDAADEKRKLRRRPRRGKRQSL